MAAQHSRYDDRLAAEAAVRAARVSLRVPVKQVRLDATPAVCWDLIHYRGMSVRDAANKLGLKPALVLEMLVDYRAVAEAQDLKTMRAIDRATAADTDDGGSDERTSIRRRYPGRTI